MGYTSCPESHDQPGQLSRAYCPRFAERDALESPTSRATSGPWPRWPQAAGREPNFRATTSCPFVGELLIALMAFEHRAVCAATPKTSRLRRGVSAPTFCAPLAESHAINLTGGHIHGPEARPRSRRRGRRH